MNCEEKECPYYNALVKQDETIQNLTELTTILIKLLAQHDAVEEYDYKLRKILQWNDVVI